MDFVNHAKHNWNRLYGAAASASNRNFQRIGMCWWGHTPEPDR